MVSEAILERVYDLKGSFARAILKAVLPNYEEH